MSKLIQSSFNNIRLEELILKQYYKEIGDYKFHHEYQHELIDITEVEKYIELKDIVFHKNYNVNCIWHDNYFDFELYCVMGNIDYYIISQLVKT